MLKWRPVEYRGDHVAYRVGGAVATIARVWTEDDKEWLYAVMQASGFRKTEIASGSTGSAPAAQAECERIVAQVTDIMKMLVAELGLSNRAITRLEHSGINTVADLISRSKPELLKIKGLGRLTMNEIERAVLELELKLRP